MEKNVSILFAMTRDITPVGAEWGWVVRTLPTPPPWQKPWCHCRRVWKKCMKSTLKRKYFFLCLISIFLLTEVCFLWCLYIMWFLEMFRLFLSDIQFLSATLHLFPLLKLPLPLSVRIDLVVYTSSTLCLLWSLWRLDLICFQFFWFSVSCNNKTC